MPARSGHGTSSAQEELVSASTSELSTGVVMSTSIGLCLVGISYYLSGTELTQGRLVACGGLVAVLFGFYMVTIPFVRRCRSIQ